ncbi:MAG: cysteine-rich CWC family protein [Betaproteobacteria bacterium]|nr:cysteine-rich CWC family protein [Betaproteobacteria bacterium]
MRRRIWIEVAGLAQASVIPEPNHTCPLCGGPNGCAPAASGTFGSPCWCNEASFSPELLARVPEAIRGKACICRTCVAAARHCAPPGAPPAADEPTPRLCRHPPK